ncbi:MAG TPA: hypothetical protein DIW43_14825 [Spongiibacteraceae bacterium]|nr:hypothetical protein [Spongiibacteraceae bacterium]HCS28730.1 hypothetical protein [Spongiibacteraceae bacterium]|tara:strand:+ start:1203 stop:1589 length:387 start_codon:yes stop_codon:yes gene_type:complete
MKLLCLLLAPFVLQACALPQQTSDTDTQVMNVDAADSLNIADFHGPLGNKADKEEERDSASTSGDRENAATAAIIARSDYRPSKGPMNAYTTIHESLYKRCPGGWNKLKEWTQSDDGLFYLYISARCR